jgi:hypothetical protein
MPKPSDTSFTQAGVTLFKVDDMTWSKAEDYKGGTYRCKKGHQAVFLGVGDSYMFCTICFRDWQLEQFPMEEVLATPKAKPNPGSDEAMLGGCRCPNSRTITGF